MSTLHFTIIFTSLLATALAWSSPSYNGYTRVWQTTFAGKAGTLPFTNNWNIITGNIHYNNEVQTYTSSNNNVQCSGKGTLQLIPRRDSRSPGGWTSGQIESKYAFTPKAGKITRVEAALRLGGNAAVSKRGMWPAFWMLGESIRHGTSWPKCGEIDIMENINGQSIASGTLHCDVSPGGVCNEGTGLGSTTTLPDDKYHVFRVEFDRKSSNIKSQTITWSRDGKQFAKISGAQIGDSKIWKAVCQSPMYFILNVAVGGIWVCTPSQILTIK
ncbi:hypothetical protein G7046_g2533 [Stylonectria norvegica]|nr:hypothetical protein G7046_g2533 [Stylonectria norvegica]